MRKVGLFGGTFDPPHIGHIKVLTEAQKRLGLDSLILIPAGGPPHKANKRVTDRSHRLHMAELAFSGLPDCRISEYEIRKQTPSYSVDLVKHFRQKLPDCELYFIIGADSFADLPTWWHYRELLTLCRMIVVSRPDTEKAELLQKFEGNETPPRVFFLDNVHMDISSTQIRALIYANKDVSELVPENVRQYIKENHLYESKADEINSY